MTVLHIKDFPNDLHKRAKGLALRDDETLREFVIAACEAEAKRREQPDGGQEG